VGGLREWRDGSGRKDIKRLARRVKAVLESIDAR